jgi:hypothetical protein
MKIETKYNIGEKKFFIDYDNNQYEVKLCEIKSIQTKGNHFNEYVIEGGFYGKTRRESELYNSFEEAKKQAIIKQKAQFKIMLERIEDQTEPIKIR